MAFGRGRDKTVEKKMVLRVRRTLGWRKPTEVRTVTRRIGYLEIGVP